MERCKLNKSRPTELSKEFRAVRPNQLSDYSLQCLVKNNTI